MELQEVLDRLTPIFREVFDSDTLVATATLDANQVPGWDSLNNLRLLVSIEQKMGVTFNAVEVPDLKNVGDLARRIIEKLGG
ncbi:MAG: acyl carrier protein [Magnetococcales bacterium]|nr:acyl carrier protein [Magnetococcales bacterium]